MSVGFDKSKVRVLVTDDEDSIRSMLVTTLRDAGWAAEGAIHGKDALEKLRKEVFHVILSDINMPEMTGMELLEAVRKEFPKIEFIIMTSHATLDTAIKAVGLGAYDYLHKPFEDINLVPRKIEKVAEKILLRQQNQELMRRLKTATMELKRLFQVVSPLNGVLDLQELRKKTVESFSKLFDDAQAKASWWIKNSEGQWECAAAVPDEAEFKAHPDPGTARDAMTGLRSPLLGMFTTPDGREEAILFENLKDAATQIFLQQVDMCFEKASAHAEIAAMANKDGLTRLYNHRYFQERIRQELAQAQRQKSGMSVILMDVDHFKHYNDRNGHPAGDALLRQLADLLSQQKNSDGSGKRVTDILARYGGEEFVMILPFTLHDGALVKAERVRAVVEEFLFEHREAQPLGKVTMSIGVASFPEHGSTAEELIAAADRALYISKRKGRNRVTSASTNESQESMASTQEIPKPAEVAQAKTLGALLADEFQTDQVPVTESITAPVVLEDTAPTMEAAEILAAMEASEAPVEVAKENQVDALPVESPSVPELSAPQAPTPQVEEAKSVAPLMDPSEIMAAMEGSEAPAPELAPELANLSMEPGSSVTSPPEPVEVPKISVPSPIEALATITSDPAEESLPTPPPAAVAVKEVNEAPPIIEGLTPPPAATTDLNEIAAKMEKLTADTQMELEETQKKMEAIKVGTPTKVIDFDLNSLMSAIDEAVSKGKAKA